MARMAGWLLRFGRGFDQPLDIGSSLLKQGKFPANRPENHVFGVLDLAFARTVNGADYGPFRLYRGG
jgi:hypothetical protein